MKKSTKIVLIVLAIIIPIILLVVGGFVVLGIIILGNANSAMSEIGESILSNIHSEKDLVGTWVDKNTKISVVLNADKTVEFYTEDKKSLYIKGTYTVEQDYDNDIGDEYIITITTYNRIVDGKTYTDKYTTKFSIVTEDYKEAVMMNVVTYTLYYLEKKDSIGSSSSTSIYTSSYTNSISNTISNNTTTNTLNTINTTNTTNTMNTTSITNTTNTTNTVSNTGYSTNTNTTINSTTNTTINSNR